MQTRREILAAGAGMAVAAATGGRVDAVTTPEPALREIGRSRGIDVGSAIKSTTVFSPRRERYRALIAKHCETITPENELKPAWLLPTTSSTYNFFDTDQIALFCAENGQKLHGHTLYWWVRPGPWNWTDADDYATVKKVYGGFIRDVVGHYPQAVSWDVFTEIIGQEGPVFRKNFLVRKFGYDFIDFCFRVANEVSPNARLLINEENSECGRDWCGRKQENVLAVLKKLKAMGTPIHGFGIQSHLSSKDSSSASAKATLKFIERLADLGCEVHLSEMDVNDSQWPEDFEKRDALVARHYETYLTAVLSHPAVKRLTFWGISDYDNWIAWGGAPWEARKKGRPRPALFDDKNDPKPAFDAVVRALQSAPVRT
jgi:endo-1,4-beta-xylanase